jgi:hypothetical protein
MTLPSAKPAFAPVYPMRNPGGFCCQEDWPDIETDMENPEKIIGLIIAG